MTHEYSPFTRTGTDAPPSGAVARRAVEAPGVAAGITFDRAVGVDVSVCAMQLATATPAATAAAARPPDDTLSCFMAGTLN